MRALKIAVLPVLFMLTACGGGNSGLPDVDQTFAGATAAVPVSASVLNAATASVSSQTGTLDDAALTFAFAGLLGAINPDRTQIILTNGGQVTLDPAGDGYATRFSSAPQGGPATRGIIGIAATDVPIDGTATYTGDTRINAVVGTDLYDLTGNAEVAIDFAGGRVTTTLDALSGTVLNPVTGSSAVLDAGTLTIADAMISNSGFSGGVTTATGAPLALSEDATTALNGQFFGPQANEAGGTFAIIDTEKIIYGDFLAD
ncbi:transferrin-binding protein-like solute binding protein [Yoonia sp. GPGPB17]|uniref:transferrin-binding protein-like solute binding protein n=1 Tax=Yoonia sp. GPGPB17 TaxID=3026147 RepID=UPI0030C4557F